MDTIRADTTAEAFAEQIKVLRRLSVSERAAMAFELSDNLRQIVVDGVCHRHPAWDETRVRRETFRIVYGDRLYTQVFGQSRTYNE